MSILSKKKDVFNQIAMLKTANEIVVNRDLLKTQSISLINRKVNKDPFIFLIDLLTIVSGSDSVNKVIKNILSNVGNYESAFKEKFKEEVTNIIGGDKSDGGIPSQIKNGYKIHINKLDYNNDLFIPDNTSAHVLYLSSFQLKLQNCIKTPNVRQNINNSISAEYNNVSGFFTIYPNNTNLKYKDFLFNLIDDVKLDNTSNIINNSFSDLFNGKNLNKEQLIQNQQIDIVLNKFVIETDEDNSYFQFEDGESELINDSIATNYEYYNNVGSEQIKTGISNDDLLASTLKYGGYNAAFFNDVISKLNANVDQKDKQSMTNGFLSKFLLSLKNNITKNFILSTSTILVYSLAQNFSNTSINNKVSPMADIDANKNIIKCMISNITNSIMNGLFEILKRDILKIVAGVTVLYIQESADKYKKIIQSLFKIR